MDPLAQDDGWCDTGACEVCARIAESLSDLALSQQKEYLFQMQQVLIEDLEAEIASLRGVRKPDAVVADLVAAALRYES